MQKGGVIRNDFNFRLCGQISRKGGPNVRAVVIQSLTEKAHRRRAGHGVGKRGDGSLQKTERD